MHTAVVSNLKALFEKKIINILIKFNTYFFHKYLTDKYVFILPKHVPCLHSLHDKPESTTAAY